MKEVRIGCSGWSYRDWREFYPPGTPAARWLAHYATVFDTVEVNATFYRLPKVETVRTWGEQVPAGFRFAVKGSRYLTHMKRLRDLGPGLARYWERIEPLRRALLRVPPPHLVRQRRLRAAGGARRQSGPRRRQAP